LANEQFYPAEELATALLGAAEPPSPLATLPSLLALRVPLLRALAAAVDGRGRPDLAVAPLGRALLLVEAELANAPTATDLWLGRARLLADLADLARRS
jgi:hypothetical protein